MLYRNRKIHVIFLFHFSFPVSGKTAQSKRSLGYATNKAINFRVFTCYYDDCIPPPDSNQVPPPMKRPADAKFWSNVSKVYAVDTMTGFAFRGLDGVGHDSCLDR